VVRRYPVVLAWLADGSLSVTTVRILRRVLTPENYVGVLTEARHRSKKEVELIEARLNPKADVPSTIRRVPGAPASAPPLVLNPASLFANGDPATVSSPVSNPPAHGGGAAARLPPATEHGHEVGSSTPRPVVAPVSPERYRVQFTVSKETHDKLRHVQDLLCREIPDGDPAAIFERALNLLVADIEKKKLAAATRPRAPREKTTGSRDIAAHVRRAVWTRDAGQCAFKGAKGRCTERRFLEWHHVQPFGHQGPGTVDNIALRCRAHNAYESELVFGRFEPSPTARPTETALFPGNPRRSGTADPPAGSSW